MLTNYSYYQIVVKEVHLKFRTNWNKYRNWGIFCLSNYRITSSYNRTTLVHEQTILILGCRFCNSGKWKILRRQNGCNSKNTQFDRVGSRNISSSKRHENDAFKINRMLRGVYQKSFPQPLRRTFPPSENYEKIHTHSWGYIYFST